MEEKIRYTLGRNERLKSRKAIEHLFKCGKSISTYPIRALYSISTPEAFLTGSSIHTASRLQAGFTVSSRHFKKAVDRNRIKRLLREAYRLQKNELLLLPQLENLTLSIFFIYVGKEIPGYSIVFEKMSLVLNRLIKISRESR